MKKLASGLLWILAFIALVAIVLRLTVLEPWTIPADVALDASLRPTLKSGDLVLMMTRGERRFGELVRCADPEDAQRYIVGRIVGLENDVVEVDGPSVRVNGNLYNTTDGCADGVTIFPHPTTGQPVEGSCERVEMAGGWHMRSYSKSSERPSKHTVGQGRVFLVSDNRSFHDDSRDFGAVPAETCTHLVLFRLWSAEGFGDASARFTAIH